MNVLFVDINGVLNTPYSKGFVKNSLMKLLIKIVRKTDAKIVVSSTWRMFAKDTIERAFDYYGVDIFDYTPKMTIKREEIQAWVDDHDIDKFAILDDNPKAAIAGHYFQVNGDKGLTPKIADEVINYLNSNSSLPKKTPTKK